VLTAVDAAVIVIDAEPDRVAQTLQSSTTWRCARCRISFSFNKLDRPGANFDATLAALRAAYGPHVVAAQLPIGSGPTFAGIVDLAHQTGARPRRQRDGDSVGNAAGRGRAAHGAARSAGRLR